MSARPPPRPALPPRSRPGELPEPDAAALEVSAALLGALAQEIAEAGGWIGFDRYMAQALYAPGLGYYSAGAQRFGPGGDFVTAPEISPLFGGCLATQCAQWLAQLADAGVAPVVWEFGAGTGALAGAMLDELARLGFDDVQYRIVEVSAPLRAQQREALAARLDARPGSVQWVERLPERIRGVVIGNEVLDAMPVRLYRIADGEVFERGVAIDDDALVFADRPADSAFRARVLDTLRRAGWWQGGRLEDAYPDGYLSELGEHASAWVETVASQLEHGALLLTDYGFPTPEFHHPQRVTGTLACHYRHRAHAEPLLWPGLQDITAHVDFGAVALAAGRAGLDCLGYASQASFLIDCGIADRFALLAATDALGRHREAQALQTLVSEAEMGELFKAIAFGRGLPDDAAGFRRFDRRGALGC